MEKSHLIGMGGFQATSAVSNASLASGVEKDGADGLGNTLCMGVTDNNQSNNLDSTSLASPIA